MACVSLFIATSLLHVLVLLTIASRHLCFFLSSYFRVHPHMKYLLFSALDVYPYHFYLHKYKLSFHLVFLEIRAIHHIARVKLT